MPQSDAGRIVGVAEFGSPEAESASVVVRQGPRGAGTVMVFSSFQAKREVPTPEFVGSLHPYGLTTIFVMDIGHRYYLEGLAAVADSTDEAAQAVRALVPRGSRLLGTLGSSVGGFGAILYGCLLDVPHVVAFGPRTYVTAETNVRLARMRPGHRDLDVDGPHTDLRRLLARDQHPTVEVHVSGSDRLDAEQMARIEDLDGVTIHRYPAPDHDCARWLKQQALLPGIIENGLSAMGQGRRRWWQRRS